VRKGRNEQRRWIEETVLLKEEMRKKRENGGHFKQNESNLGDQCHVVAERTSNFRGGGWIGGKKGVLLSLKAKGTTISGGLAIASMGGCWEERGGASMVGTVKEKKFSLNG